MLRLNRPALGCPAGWTCLGTAAPGLGFDSTRLHGRRGCTHVCRDCRGAGGGLPAGFHGLPPARVLLLSARDPRAWHRSARAPLRVLQSYCGELQNCSRRGTPGMLWGGGEYLKYRLGLGPQPSRPRAERDANSRSSHRAAELRWPEVRVRVQPRPRGQRGCPMDGLPPGTGSSPQHRGNNWVIVSVPPGTQVVPGNSTNPALSACPAGFPSPG